MTTRLTYLAVRSLCRVNYSIERNLLKQQKSATGDNYYIADMQMAIIPGNANLKFTISHKGEQVTSVTVEFPKPV